MTEIARRTREPEQRFIIDTPARAHAELARITAAGRLDAKAPERPYGDREIVIPVWVYPEAEQAGWRPSGRTVAIAAGTTVAVAVVGFVGYEVVAFVARYFVYIVGVIAVILGLTAVVTVRRSGGCEGVHIRH